jgi:hypothetical protein
MGKTFHLLATSAVGNALGAAGDVDFLMAQLTCTSGRGSWPPLSVFVERAGVTF